MGKRPMYCTSYILVLRRRHLLKHSQRAEYHLDTTEDRHDWPNSYQTLSQERACFWRRSPVALSGMWTAVLGSISYTRKGNPPGAKPSRRSVSAGRCRRFCSSIPWFPGLVVHLRNYHLCCHIYLYLYVICLLHLQPNHQMTARHGLSRLW